MKPLRALAGGLMSMLLAGAFAGCLGTETSSPMDPQPIISKDLVRGGESHAVVALFDTGINPYHPIFRVPNSIEPRVAMPDIPEYETVTISFDLSYEAAVEADGLANLKRDTLYWFKDTRVLAYAHDEKDAVFVRPVLDEDGHGTAVASLVARASPDSLILAVETFSDDDAMYSWANNQSWIDVFSISFGLPANAPLEFVDPVGGVIASRLAFAVDAGKTVVVAAGNEVAPSIASPWGGPPTVIAVGGGSAESNGETAKAAKTPDFLSEYLASVARHDSTEDEWRYDVGTSFGAPIVAGTIAQAIHEVRTAWGYTGSIRDGAFAFSGELRLTNADVRFALNHTAEYWMPTDYRPAVYPDCTHCNLAATIPIVPEVPGTPVGPWLQMGWGFVNESLVPKLVNVLLGKEPLPEKPQGAVDFMNQVYAARELYWSLPRPR